MIKVAAGDNYRQQAKEKDVWGRGGELLFLPLDSSLLYCVAAKAGSCNGLWRCCLLSWDFFSTCCFDKPTGSLLVSPFAGGAKALCEAKLGWKAEDPGQPLNKGALALLCKGRSCTVAMQETSFNDTRQQGLMLQVPAVLPQEEVQGGQGWAKSAGSRLVLLSPAEQVGTCVQSMQASTGSDSQGAAEIAHRALSYEGKRGACHDSALTSKALNLSCEFFNSSESGGFNLTLTWRMAQLHLMPSQKGLLSALSFWWEPTAPVTFIPQLQIWEALAVIDVQTYQYGHAAFLTFS